MQHTEKKARNEARYLVCATNYVDSEFQKPGTKDWISQPGTLQEWVAFGFRRAEMIARKVREMKAWDAMPDKDGWVDDYDNEVIESVMADHGLKWPLESLVNESANDFVNRLVSEGRHIFKDGLISSGGDDNHSLEKAVEKMTYINFQI